MPAVPPVPCALVGVGVMGSEHAEILARSPLADLRVCCDIDPAAAGRTPPGVRFTTSLEEALATPGLEALFIATPQAVHLEGVRAGVERGLAIFCEKPIAADLADADAIVAIAGHYGQPLVFGHMLRFDPRIRAIVEAVEAGEVGRVVHLSGRFNGPDYEGRALAARTTLAVEMAIHGIDVARWIAGDIERVYGEVSATDLAGPGLADALVATIRFTSGAVATVETNWALPTESGISIEQFLSVVGSRGIAYLDARDSGVGIFGGVGHTRLPRMLSYRDPAGAYYGVYRTELDYFLSMVRDGRRWPITASDARAALTAALALDRSIAERRPIDVSEMG